MQIRRKGKYMVMQGTKQGNLYILHGSIITRSISTILQADNNASNSSSNDNSLWHLHLGYMSEKRLKILNKRGLLGNYKVEPLLFCEQCVHRKEHQTKFPKVVHTTKAMLDYIHFDYQGPSSVPSVGGTRYFLSMINDYSRMIQVFDSISGILLVCVDAKSTGKCTRSSSK